MKILSNLESLLEKKIEGFFRRKFKGEVQPVEIAKKLLRTMEEKQTVSVERVYVPNKYIVFLHHDDFEKLRGFEEALTEELVNYLLKYAKQKCLSLLGRLEIVVQPVQGMEQGEIKIESRFVEDEQPFLLDGKEPGETNSGDGEGLTEKVLAELEKLTNGMGTFELSTGRVSIGRKETNTIVLDDPNVSRFHAVIEYRDGKFVLEDAQSLNGTYVNGHKVSSKVLEPGDMIKLGNTVLIFKVV